tara:strand:+ start:92 stop:364 length:273 start_codon:yes stop_codon:yes gene_type:complete
MKLSDVLIWILFITSIAVVSWYFLGNSPTLVESLIVLIISLVFISNIHVIKNSVKLNFMEKRFDILEMNIKESFNNMKNDMDLIKKKLKI